MFYDLEERGDTERISVIFSNLGWCLSNSSDENFFDNFLKIGVQLYNSLIEYGSFNKNELNKIIDKAIGRIWIGHSVKNHLGLNYNRIGHITDMIGSLKTYTKRKDTFEKELLSKVTNNHYSKKDIIDFYSFYFSILNNGNDKNERINDFKNLLNKA